MNSEREFLELKISISLAGGAIRRDRGDRLSDGNDYQRQYRWVHRL